MTRLIVALSLVVATTTAASLALPASAAQRAHVRRDAHERVAYDRPFGLELRIVPQVLQLASATLIAYVMHARRHHSLG